MAVYTHISETQLQDFLARYDLGSLKRYEGIQQGVENSNYHLYTSGGHFILTLFEKRVSPVDLPFFFAFTDHLARRGILCPRALANKDGQVVGMLAGKPAAIITFLEGTDIAPEEITARHCFALGQFVARMHVASYDFNRERENILGLDGWKDLAAEMAGRADQVIPTLGGIIADELSYLAGIWPRDLPAGVVHADLFPDNVLFDGPDIGGVIDFYFSCSDFYAYDLAIVINAWCFDRAGVFRRDLLAALIEGYEGIRILDVDEKRYLPDLMRGAALRFLLTRLYDWINRDPAAMVNVKEPHEYFAKLIFHQNERIEL